MTSAFSSNDSECIARDVETKHSVNELENIWNDIRLGECAAWITRNNYKKICLQFPDELIPYSNAILTAIQEKCGDSELFILGDTSYGSCCVDEMAAAHINSEAIIHFGHACLSKVVRLPILYIFPSLKISTAELARQIESKCKDRSEQIAVFYDVGYYYVLDDIKSSLNEYTNIEFGQLALETEADVLSWVKPKHNLKESVCIFVGDENQTFFNMTIAVKAKTWYSYDPSKNQLNEVVSPLATNWMRRRNFYIEKCKDAQSLGIVIGTLSAKGYLDIVTHIQTLARGRGIRTYLFSVGKVNPAKLGNFLEIDCFVFVGCPENNIYTSRDFHKPLLSVFEVELALNPAWHEQFPDFYCLDFKEILPSGKYHRDIGDADIDEYDVSLVTGKVRSLKANDTSGEDGMQLERKHNQLMESTSSTTFQDRSWTGLDQSLGHQEPVKITKGRSGIPIKYSENSTD